MDISEAVKLSMERYDSTFTSLAQYESMEKYCELNNISIDDIDWESYSDEEKEYFREWNKETEKGKAYYDNLILRLLRIQFNHECGNKNLSYFSPIEIKNNRIYLYPVGCNYEDDAFIVDYCPQCGKNVTDIKESE